MVQNLTNIYTTNFQKKSSKNNQLDKLLRSKLSSSLLARENDFKQIDKTAYNGRIKVNSKAHQNRNIHKLST